MDVITERPSEPHPSCTVQVGHGTWSNGTYRELAIRNVWPDANGNNFYRGGQMPVTTAMQGIEIAAEENLLSADEIKDHVATLVAVLAERARPAR